MPVSSEIKVKFCIILECCIVDCPTCNDVVDPRSSRLPPGPADFLGHDQAEACPWVRPPRYTVIPSRLLLLPTFSLPVLLRCFRT